MEAAEIIRISSISWKLVSAAHKPTGIGIKEMRIFTLRNITLPQVGCICARHNEIALSFPFCREIALLPDGDLIVFTGKYKVLRRAFVCFNGLLVITII